MLELVPAVPPEWQSELVSRISSLRSVDVAALDDVTLSEHLLRAHDLCAHGVDVHFRVQGANAVMLGELAFVCRDLLGYKYELRHVDHPVA
ncbi:MAG TPA: hypothetical protein VGJ44_24845 [Kribbellaceae bacterium]